MPQYRLPGAVVADGSPSATAGVILIGEHKGEDQEWRRNAGNDNHGFSGHVALSIISMEHGELSAARFP